jgi:hypothetical protein
MSNNKPREALERLLEAIGPGECDLDHHGYCQSHFVENPCSVALARAALREATPAAKCTHPRTTVYPDGDEVCRDCCDKIGYVPPSIIPAATEGGEKKHVYVLVANEEEKVRKCLVVEDSEWAREIFLKLINIYGGANVCMASRFINDVPAKLPASPSLPAKEERRKLGARERTQKGDIWEWPNGKLIAIIDASAGKMVGTFGIGHVYRPAPQPAATGQKEPETMEEIDAYLRANGYDQHMVGRWGNAIADAAFAREELKRALGVVRMCYRAMRRRYPITGGHALHVNGCGCVECEWDAALAACRALLGGEK